MRVSAGFLDMACALFAAVGPVRARRMFGAAGLYAGEVMFALVADDVIYLKADDALAAELEALGCGPFVVTTGDKPPQVMRYRRLPDAALDDPEAARAWGLRALDAALRATR